jgi:prephenate dehydrogenase
MQIRTIGIIGFGSMGQLLARKASDFIHSTNIKIVENSALPSDFSYTKINFEDLKTCDLIIPAVSAKNLESVITRLAHLDLNGQQIICSISATMSYAEKILKTHLSNSQFILSHPSFLLLAKKIVLPLVPTACIPSGEECLGVVGKLLLIN